MKLILLAISAAFLSVTAMASEVIECHETYSFTSNGKVKTSIRTMSITVNADESIISASDDGDVYIDEVVLKKSGNLFIGSNDSGEVTLKLPNNRSGLFQVAYSYRLFDDESDHAGDWYKQKGCTSR